MVQFAVIKEQGVTFGVVVVKDHVIECRSDADDAVSYWTHRLGCTTVLYGAERHKVYGDRNLIDFVSNLHPSQIPWRKMAT